jgi:hypothetical protein
MLTLKIIEITKIINKEFKAKINQEIVNSYSTIIPMLKITITTNQ